MRNSRIYKIMVMCCIAIITVFSLSACSSAVDEIEKLTIPEDNTSIREASQDTADIMAAIRDAQEAVQKRDTSVYGNRALSDGISYQNVINANDLKSAAETKRYKDVIYHAYWDKDKNSLFWSSDGSDDLLNADGDFNIEHKNTMRLLNTTPINELK